MTQHFMLSTPTGDVPTRWCIPAESRAAVIVVEEPGGTDLERTIAHWLNDGNVATLLTDGLTATEHKSAQHAAEHCSNIPLIAGRLEAITDWLAACPELADPPVGYFATGTSAAAALWAAADRPGCIAAVVALDARPLLAAPALARVRAPTLFITRDARASLLKVNRAGFERLMCEKRLEILAGTDVDRIAAFALSWFDRHFDLPGVYAA